MSKEISFSTDAEAEAMRAICEPAKLAPLLGLASLAFNESIDYAGLAERTNELQGSVPVRNFTKASVLKHCEGTLLHAGLVELSSGPNSLGRDYPQSTKARLTEKGRSVGLAYAGTHLSLQLAFPRSHFLENTLGTTAPARGTPNLKPLIYRQLLDEPKSVGQLTKNVGCSQASVSRIVQNLADREVLEITDFRDPEALNLNIVSDPRTHIMRGGKLAKTVGSVATKMYEKGQRKFTGQDILEQVCEVHGDSAPEDVWAIIVRLAKESNRMTFLKPTQEYGRQRSKITISDAYHAHIEKLFKVWHFLDTDSSEALRFQRAAQQRAHEFIHTPELLCRAVGPRTSLTPNSQSPTWLLMAKDEVAARGENGIDLRELYGQVITPYDRVDYEWFCRRLKTSPELQMVEQRLVGKSERRAKAIIRQQPASDISQTELVVNAKYLNNTDLLFPQTFQPFDDPDKVIWFAHGRPAEIEACGAALGVDPTNTIRGLHGKSVELSNPEKLALLLLTQGATLRDIDAYCIDPDALQNLLMRLGVGYTRKNDYTSLHKAVLLTCREMLEPIEPTSEEYAFKPVDVKKMLMRNWSGKATFAARTRAAALTGAYTYEDLPPWASLNLQLLLTYANGRISSGQISGYGMLRDS